jgi:hypothetical protein
MRLTVARRLRFGRKENQERKIKGVGAGRSCSREADFSAALLAKREQLRSK